jgi:endonuclease/exonuclease/phosphatase family metal-dependent hydrolase
MHQTRFYVKILPFSFLFIYSHVFSQVKIVSWNIQNFGIQKKAKIGLMASLIRDADIVMVQEVQIDQDGIDAIEMLELLLEKDGKKWNSVVSRPTNGRGTECYAYLWKSSTVTLIGKPWLESTLDYYIDREPYMARFKAKNKNLLLANLHTVPKKKMPWLEIAELDRLDNMYKKDNLIIAGDFNLSSTNSVFEELKYHGLYPALYNLKTTIKMEPKGSEKFANDYDNFLVEKAQIKILRAGRIDFTNNFPTLKEARKVSDHLPVFLLLN